MLHIYSKRSPALAMHHQAWKKSQHRWKKISLTYKLQMSTTCNMLRIISRLLTDIRSISGKTYCYLINYRYIRKYPFLNISVSQKHLFSIELHLDLLNCKIRICTKINLKTREWFDRYVKQNPLRYTRRHMRQNCLFQHELSIRHGYYRIFIAHFRQKSSIIQRK